MVTGELKNNHDLDVADNIHEKESAILGLPYKSIFAKEVQVGEQIERNGCQRKCV